MPNLTLAQMRARGRLYIQDTDTANTPEVSDTDFNLLINQAVQDYSELHPHEIVALVGSPAFVAGDEGLLSTIVEPDVRALLRAEIQATSPARGRNLERLKVPEIRFLQEQDATAGTPVYWAAHREESVVDLWRIFIYPTVAAPTTLNVYGSYFPVTMSADGNICQFLGDGSHVIARMAAVSAAHIAGRDDAFIARIAAELPPLLRAHVHQQRLNTRPRPDPAAELI